MIKFKSTISKHGTDRMIINVPWCLTGLFKSGDKVEVTLIGGGEE
jgi:hypothetical protein